jgi:hypothetical protein
MEQTSHIPHSALDAATTAASLDVSHWLQNKGNGDDKKRYDDAIVFTSDGCCMEESDVVFSDHPTVGGSSIADMEDDDELYPKKATSLSFASSSSLSSGTISKACPAQSFYRNYRATSRMRTLSSTICDEMFTSSNASNTSDGDCLHDSNNEDKHNSSTETRHWMEATTTTTMTLTSELTNSTKPNDPFEITGDITTNSSAVSSGITTPTVTSTTVAPGRIQKIDATSVQRIVAGQAVTDLASAVKELVDNSLDAASQSINGRLKHCCDLLF